MTFELIAEIEPPSGPDLSRLAAQIAALDTVCAGYLVPDSPLGRPSVASTVVASRITTPQRPAIACLNARDRNLLGVQRDLLTARHLGVDELLLVRGDAPSVGERAGSLGVRDLVRECEAAGVAYSVTAGAGRLAPWKASARRIFCQVSWTLDEFLRRRDALATDRPVYAGVLVVPNAAVARGLASRVPELAPPVTLIDALDRDHDAGVHAAAALVHDLEVSGAFAGVHLVVGARPRAAVEAITAVRACVTVH